jgi:hypothetical protein
MLIRPSPARPTMQYLVAFGSQSLRRKQVLERKLRIAGYEDQIRAAVNSNYTEVTSAPRGGWSHKRKSDGMWYQSAASKDAAIDLRVVDVSNTASKAIYSNTALNSLKEVGAQWRRLAETNPFVIPDADSEEIRSEVSFLLKQLLTTAGYREIELQSDRKIGLGATAWRSGELYGTMLIIPGDWDVPKLWSKVWSFYCKGCSGGGTDDLQHPNARIVQGVITEVPTKDERVNIYFEMFPREGGGGAYVVSVAGPGKARKAVEGADEKIHTAVVTTQK